jgi:hypothetical protein
MAADEQELDKLYPGIEKQVTFATVLTLTDVAQRGQASSIATIEDRFTVRGNWEQPSNAFGVRITPATKDNLESSVHTAADWLVKHETGQDRTGDVAIPTQITRPNIQDKIGSAKRPRNLIGAFKVTSKATGLTWLFQRIQGKLVPLYLISRGAHIRKQSTVIEPTVETVTQELPASFERNLTKAFNTAK